MHPFLAFLYSNPEVELGATTYVNQNLHIRLNKDS